MNEKELKLIDRQAKRQGLDRSKLMREAVGRYLAELVQLADEEKYIASYAGSPEPLKEARAWRKVQAWPEQ